MSPHPVVARIRKLRALASRNDNPNEAAAAAAAAERLCQEHRISEAMIESAPAEQGQAMSTEEIDTWARLAPEWKRYLLFELAEMHGCALVYLQTEGERGYEVRAYGTLGDLELVREMYAWLVSEVDRMAEAIGGSPSYGRSFRIGASEGIRDALKRAHEQAMASAPPKALAVFDERLALAQDARGAAHKRLRKEKQTRAPRVDEVAYEAGHDEGTRIYGRHRRDRQKALR